MVLIISFVILGLAVVLGMIVYFGLRKKKASLTKTDDRDNGTKKISPLSITLYLFIALLVFSLPFWPLSFGLSQTDWETPTKTIIMVVGGIVWFAAYCKIFISEPTIKEVWTIYLGKGMPLITLTSKRFAYVFIIPGLMSVIKDQINLQCNQLSIPVVPSNPESAELLSKEDKERFESDPLHRSVTAMVEVDPFFRINSAKHVTYSEMLSTEDKARERLTAGITSAVTSWSTTCTLVMLMDPKYLGEVTANILRDVQAYMDKYGIIVLDLKLTVKPLQAYLDTINEASQTEAKMKIVQAQLAIDLLSAANSADMAIQAARGKTESEKLENSVQIDFLTKMKDEVVNDDDGKHLMQLRTAIEIAKESGVYITEGGLYGVTAGLNKFLTSIKKGD